MNRKEIQLETYYVLDSGDMFFTTYDRTRRYFLGNRYIGLDYYSRKAMLASEGTPALPEEFMEATSVRAWESKQDGDLQPDPFKDAVKQVITDWNSMGEVDRSTVQALADLTQMDLY